MKNNRVSNLEFGILSYFLTRAFFIGATFDLLIKIIKQDSWIVPLISIIIAIFTIHIVNYIMNYKPNFNIFKKLKCLFKNNIIAIIIIIISFIFCILNFLNLNSFIHNQFLNKTPLFVISLIFIIATIYILNLGLNSITRTSIILFYINIILIIITFLCLINHYNISNIKPFFMFDRNELGKSLLCFFSFNISPIFLITVIPKNNIKNNKIKKTLILSSILSFFTLFLITFETLSTFGYELTRLYQYPEFHILKNISLLGLSSRIESILVIQWLFDLLLYNIFILYFISTGIKFLFNKISIKTINIVLCTLLVVLTSFFSKYNIFINNFILNYAYMPIFLIILLLIITIIIKIKISN